MDELGFPLVLKIPDGSFSRGVNKVGTAEEFRRIADELFEDTDLLLAQKFMPTEFDWRVGVLAGEPLFVCQYLMARSHWQIVKHRPDGSLREGGSKTFDLDQAPPEVVDIAVRAAQLIGDGLYGVDIKETDSGFFVIEVNDNPNLEHGIEDQVGKDEVWIAAVALVRRPLRAVARAGRLGDSPSETSGERSIRTGRLNAGLATPGGRRRRETKGGGARPRTPPRHRRLIREAPMPTSVEAADRGASAQAAALTSAPVGTDAIVFRICEAIWYGSPCEFGRRSSR